MVVGGVRELGGFQDGYCVCMFPDIWDFIVEPGLNEDVC